MLIAVLSVFSIAVYGIYITQQSPEQPIEFRHDVHVKLGVQCLYCHPGALRGPSPGLPTQNKCWGCHQQIAKTFTSDRLEVLVEYIERDEPIAWVPVAQVPDFVHFTHRPHVAAGLNCETCHGDMSTMEIAENQQVLNMGWCLQCHKSRTEDNVENNPENDQHVSELLHEKRTKLMDCGTCHY
jgi:hypothetical protein